MNQLLFIETFVFGASVIAAIYHLVLFIQQRDKFLLCYSSYLFSLASYIGFKLISNNYNPFLPTDNVWYYILEEILQVLMAIVYVLFASVTLEVLNEHGIVRTLMRTFFVLAALSIIVHVGDAIINGPGIMTHFQYAASRISLVGIATIALLFAWRIRTTTFQRTIIIGSLVYDFSGLLSIISFTQNRSMFGLSGVEPYLVGCLVDIIIFSSALGYRIKMGAIEKNDLLKKEIFQQAVLLNERKRISTELHDDLGSGLSTIRFLSEIAMSQSKNVESKNQLEKISDMSNDLVDNMRQIVWAMNAEETTLENLIQDLKKYVNDYLDTNNLSLQLQVPETFPNRKLSGESRRNIFLVVKECLHNTVKHVEATVVMFTVEANEKVKIILKDNGRGFNIEERKNKGNGLTSMSNRMKSSNGTFHIENHIGTTVTLTF